MIPAHWSCLVPFLVVIAHLAALSAAQYDPLKDFCRRFGHQSAIVDNRLYIDGGFVNWKPFSAASQNYSSKHH